ncbi:MAG: hypothetical protein IJO98_05745 [Clostridia bacterium]|nr:hypothetical protein [Clostridia bacterium]
MARIYTRREVKRRRMKYQVFAGMFDFVGIVLGLIVIAACAILLSALYHWVIRDVQASFATLWDIFTSAIIIPN